MATFLNDGKRKVLDFRSGRFVTADPPTFHIDFDTMELIQDTDYNNVEVTLDEETNLTVETFTSLQIVKFAIGDATPYTPDPDQTELRSPVAFTTGVYEKDITSATRIDDFTVQYICSIAEEECVGARITELGLIDKDGLMTCIRSFPYKEKVANREMVFKIKDIFVEDPING